MKREPPHPLAARPCPFALQDAAELTALLNEAAAANAERDHYARLTRPARGWWDEVRAIRHRFAADPGEPPTAEILPFARAG